ncbi:DNA repair ATPase [Sphaerisporangium melleum]|uniref:DNA repair ATPase n=1 Tax=Sphaerisporangium melleum TaxID=321316 RepID=A0A917VIE7_9ACTN|nr:DNA repair ATPase [Sphaerisporangium melleum]GII72363.1 DNA repair ATPase [Sphaerisporangium melleum]
MREDTVSTDPWGRVDDDGTVYVRTAEGERAVGSWQAGEPEEALAYFHRKYDELATQVELLEQRLRGTDLPPAQAEATIVKLRESIAEAHAVGDLGALMDRLAALSELVGKRREEVKAARDQARAQSREIKERIVSEAERIAEDTTHWKSGGERLRQLVEEWKGAERIDRVTEAALWKRLSAARTAFAKRRKSYFAGLDEQRESVRATKERIVAEAEHLAGSTDWGDTAAAYRDLMRQWKSAGRASREAEDELWTRFKAAQDQFFQARSAVFAERDASLRENAEAKAAILADAERILPVTDARAARAALRTVLERWEAVGPVPRESRDKLEGGLRRIDEAVRKAEEAEWKRSNPEARARAQNTVDQLRRSIEQLEARLAKAAAAGRDKDAKEAEEALAARRSWLEEAERTLAEFS